MSQIMSQTCRDHIRICLTFVEDKSKTNPLNGVWLLVVVVTHTAVLMLNSADVCQCQSMMLARSCSSRQSNSC